MNYGKIVGLPRLTPLRPLIQWRCYSRKKMVRFAKLSHL